MEQLFRARTLFFISLLFIVYATTIPWDMAHPPTLEGVSWIPGWDSDRNRIASIPDMVQNVILFAPLGFFAVFGFSGLNRHGVILATLASGLIGLGLSFAVECIQTMSATRTPSATDLATNFTGALIGGFVAAIFVKFFENHIVRALNNTMNERPGLIILILLWLVVLADSLYPFLPTLDIGLLRRNVRLFLDNPWGPKAWSALIPNALLFATLAFVTVQELPAYLGSKRWVPFISAKVGAIGKLFVSVPILILWVVFLEGCQLIIIGHSPGVQDAFIGIIGVVIGALFSVVLSTSGLRPARRLGDTTRQFPWLVLGFAILAPALRALFPYQFIPVGTALETIDMWSFVPFWIFFQNINVSTFYNVFEASAIHLPLGYALHALERSPRFGFFTCFLLAEFLEVCQIVVVNRTFDITEGIFAGLMGLFGAYAYRRMTRESELRQPEGHSFATTDAH